MLEREREADFAVIERTWDGFMAIDWRQVLLYLKINGKRS